MQLIGFALIAYVLVRAMAPKKSSITADKHDIYRAVLEQDDEDRRAAGGGGGGNAGAGGGGAAGNGGSPGGGGGTLTQPRGAAGTAGAAQAPAKQLASRDPNALPADVAYPGFGGSSTRE